MRRAIRGYKLLLNLYPHGYRAAFAAQMTQTFIDHYQDIEELEGHVGMRFWISTGMDEAANIVRQHSATLMESSFLRITAWKLVVTAMFFVPLLPVFLVAVVRTSLALPHPHVSGLGVVVAFAALLAIATALGVMVSYLLASAIVRVFARTQAIRHA